MAADISALAGVARTNTYDQSTAKSSNTLTTDGFFRLMAAELANQDMSNPMDNSEMMTQMTQIAMMQAMDNFSTSMENFSQINVISYGTSMMGKEVTLAVRDEKTGEIKKIEGTVTRVDILEGSPILYIDDDTKTGYPISSLMSIYEPGHRPPEEPEKPNDGDITDPPGTGGDDSNAKPPTTGDDDNTADKPEGV